MYESATPETFTSIWSSWSKNHFAPVVGEVSHLWNTLVHSMDHHRSTWLLMRVQTNILTKRPSWLSDILHNPCFSNTNYASLVIAKTMVPWSISIRCVFSAHNIKPIPLIYDFAFMSQKMNTNGWSSLYTIHSCNRALLYIHKVEKREQTIAKKAIYWKGTSTHFPLFHALMKHPNIKHKTQNTSKST